MEIFGRRIGQCLKWHLASFREVARGLHHVCRLVAMAAVLCVAGATATSRFFRRMTVVRERQRYARYLYSLGFDTKTVATVLGSLGCLDEVEDLMSSGDVC